MVRNRKGKEAKRGEESNHVFPKADRHELTKAIKDQRGIVLRAYLLPESTSGARRNRIEGKEEKEEVWRGAYMPSEYERTVLKSEGSRSEVRMLNSLCEWFAYNKCNRWQEAR